MLLYPLNFFLAKTIERLRRYIHIFKICIQPYICICAGRIVGPYVTSAGALLLEGDSSSGHRGVTSHPAGFYVTHHASTVELPHLPHQWLATYLFLNANGPGSLQPVYQLRSSPVLLKTFVAWRRRRDGPGTLVRLYAANGTIVACDSTHASTFKGSFVRFFLSPVLISLPLCRMVASPSTYPRIRSLRPNLDVPF